MQENPRRSVHQIPTSSWEQSAACYWVSPTGAFIIGAVAGVVIWGLDALEHFRIDDSIGADTSTVVKGLLYGGGTAQLISQAIGSASIVFGTLIEHGMLVYPEFVVHAGEAPHLAASDRRLHT